MEGRRNAIEIGDAQSSVRGEAPFAGRADRLLRLGTVLPAGVYVAVRPVQMKVQALLLGQRLSAARPCARYSRPPCEAASCFSGAAATWLAGFVLATAPEISITCGLRLGANHRDSRDRKDWKPAWKSVRRRLRHDELAFSSFCLRAWSGLAQAARGGDGLLGRRPRGAARAIPGPYERRAEHRAVS